ncbi:MAG: NUDIX domain-containing protein [Steroidobacteraceae bacterium]
MIHPAATVVLLREREGRLETLLMRRRATLGFLGGMWVFPGGRMEASDASPGAAARAHRSTATGRHGLLDADGRPLDDDVALGYAHAACREAFEEAGVLLARDAAGRPCGAELAGRLAPERARVTAEPTAFVRMLEAHDLRLDVDALCYWSHWITPSAEPKRFDTRFFVAALPDGQHASADLSELTEHRWISPVDAVAECERDALRMVPPTLYTLEDLAECHARHGTLASMLAAEAGRAAPPVMPRMVMTPGAVDVVMPWDAGYDALDGEGPGYAGAWPDHLVRRRGRVTLGRPATGHP